MDPLTAVVAARMGEKSHKVVTGAPARGGEAGPAEVPRSKGHRRQSSVELLPEEFVSHVVESSDSGDRRPSVLSQSDAALKVLCTHVHGFSFCACHLLVQGVVAMMGAETVAGWHLSWPTHDKYVANPGKNAANTCSAYGQPA